MNGGQQRYARTPEMDYGQQHALHGASACGSLSTGPHISQHGILAQHVSSRIAAAPCVLECRQTFCCLHHMVTRKAREHDSCHEHRCLLKLLHISCTAKAEPHTWEKLGLCAPDHRETMNVMKG